MKEEIIDKFQEEAEKVAKKIIKRQADLIFLHDEDKAPNFIASCRASIGDEFYKQLAPLYNKLIEEVGS